MTSPTTAAARAVPIIAASLSRFDDFDPRVFAGKRFGGILQPLLAKADGDKRVGGKLELLDQKPFHRLGAPLRQTPVVVVVAIAVAVAGNQQQHTLQSGLPTLPDRAESAALAEGSISAEALAKGISRLMRGLFASRRSTPVPPHPVGSIECAQRARRGALMASMICC